jgi:hypothetical protein
MRNVVTTEEKVFGVGFHKTATSSLRAALSLLGYEVCGHIGVSRPDIADVALQLALARIPEYDAFQDNPWPLLYREIDERCPNAKFILTTRPSENWVESAVKHFGGHSTPMREWIYGEGDPQGNEDLYIRRYESHNREVRHYFDGRPEDFVELRITQGDGWEKLCSFLNKVRPKRPFPKKNSSSFRRIKEVYNLSPTWVQRVAEAGYSFLKRGW